MRLFIIWWWVLWSVFWWFQTLASHFSKFKTTTTWTNSIIYFTPESSLSYRQIIQSTLYSSSDKKYCVSAWIKMPFLSFARLRNISTLSKLNSNNLYFLYILGSKSIYFIFLSPSKSDDEFINLIPTMVTVSAHCFEQIKSHPIKYRHNESLSM